MSWQFKDISSKFCSIENKRGRNFEDTVHILQFFRSKKQPGWNRLGMYSCEDHWHIGHVNKQKAVVQGTKIVFIQPRKQNATI